MNDEVKEILQEDHRSDILKSLDEFNTAPEFGALGILQEQITDQRREAAEPEEKEKPAPTKEYDYEKAYAPLNTSIQELGYRMDSRIADIERNLAEQRALASQQPSQQYAYNYDPDAPVTMAQLVQLQQEVQGTSRSAQEAQMRAEYLRAHLEYERFKARNPDFIVTPQELDTSFNRFMANDLTKARNTNWTGHFAQIHEQTAQPRMKSRIAELEKEVEELRKKSSKSAAQAQPISPATAQTRTATSQAIQSPSQAGGIQDFTHLPSFKKGKTFASYGKELKNALGIKNYA